MSERVMIECDCGASGEAPVGAARRVRVRPQLRGRRPARRARGSVRELERRHRVALVASLVVLLVLCAAPLVALDVSAAVVVPFAAVVVWVATVRPRARAPAPPRAGRAPRLGAARRRSRPARAPSGSPRVQHPRHHPHRPRRGAARRVVGRAAGAGRARRARGQRPALRAARHVARRAAASGARRAAVARPPRWRPSPWPAARGRRARRASSCARRRRRARPRVTATRIDAGRPARCSWSRCATRRSASAPSRPSRCSTAGCSGWPRGRPPPSGRSTWTGAARTRARAGRRSPASPWRPRWAAAGCTRCTPPTATASRAPGPRGAATRRSRAAPSTACLRPDGAVRHVVEANRLVRDADGEPIGYSGATIDITGVRHDVEPALHARRAPGGARGAGPARAGARHEPRRPAAHGRRHGRQRSSTATSRTIGRVSCDGTRYELVAIHRRDARRLAGAGRDRPRPREPGRPRARRAHARRHRGHGSARRATTSPAASPTACAPR